MVTRQQLDDLLTYAVEICTELDENLRGDAFAFADQSKQDVLSADVVVTELKRLTQRELEDLLRARGEGNVSAGRLLALADDFLDLLAHGLQ